MRPDRRRGGGRAALATEPASINARSTARWASQRYWAPPGRQPRTAARLRSRRSHPHAPAIQRNWIKLHPSCLGTHSPIDAAEQLGHAGGGAEPLEVVVHPVARQAAHLDAVTDGLSAKFSIPYCVAHTLTRGAPRTADFARVDGAVAERSARVSVSVDASLPQWGAVLKLAGREVIRLAGPRSAPERPVTEAELAAKISGLVGDRLDGISAPASGVLSAAGLSPE